MRSKVKNKTGKTISVGSKTRWMRQRKRSFRRKRQCVKRRDRKQREKSIKKILTKERADIANRTQWIEA